MDMCFASAAKEFRNQMGGGPEAASLPQPDGRGVEKWEKVAESFEKIVGDTEAALRKAEGAHQGKAAEEANASIAEVIPKAEKVSETSKGIRDSLQQQTQNQHEAFQGIPAQGDTLENGREVQLDPPQKGFVDEHKDNMFIGWMSDYEERQADFTATNEKATASRERYASQTDNVITALPQFEPDAEPAPPPPAADTAQASSIPAGGDSSAQASGAPASTSSSWAPSGSGGGGGGAVGGGGAGSVPGGGSGGPAPASTGAAWASPGGSGSGAGGKLPPGVVRGKDGTLYRQNPQTGSWERQNPHNGRWAPAPGGGPGGAGAGGARGAAGAGAGGGVGGGAGGAGGGAGSGSGQGQQPGAGGRSGTGMPGGSGAGAGGSGAGAAGGGAAGGRGGAAGPMGGAGGRGGQGGGDDEHERPSWLIEEEDVFSNDMQLVAPPVFGEAPGEGR